MRFLLMLVCSGCLVSNLRAEPSRIGQVVDDFTLPNCYGKSVSLSDFVDHDLVAMVFLGTECPLAQLYGPRLNKL
ncbi:thioredoxin domain-containing protein [Novipirellula artificiosorum]|nr:hypothetical protein [Novipirellula artificiosorum]